jgi:KDO2-lipid IV(A) lauroyltransferase
MTPDSSLFAPRYWPEWLAVGMARLAARLPYRLQTGVGRGLGRLFQRLNPYRRLVVDINLALCFPELGPREREDLKKHIFESLGISILETLAGLWAANKFFSSAGEIDGLEHLEAAQRQGKGVILLSGHFCSLDFAGRILMQHHPGKAAEKKLHGIDSPARYPRVCQGAQIRQGGLVCTGPGSGR